MSFGAKSNRWFAYIDSQDVGRTFRSKGEAETYCRRELADESENGFVDKKVAKKRIKVVMEPQEEE